MTWTVASEQFLYRYYPDYGKTHCAEALGVPRSSVRSKASQLGLKLNQEGPHWKSFQERAAKTKAGKKRPDQSDVMKRLHREGRMSYIHLRRCPPAQPALIQLKPRTTTPNKRFTGRRHTPEARRRIGEGNRAAWADPNSILNSEAFKQGQSDRMKARQASLSKTSATQNYSRTKGGKREDLGGLYVRSAWEANYARYLNWLLKKGEIHKWEFEPDQFEFEAIKRGTRSYIPDFKVWETADSEPYYVEVKGWMDARSKTKLKRMAKYYPDIRIDVVGEKQYNAIKKWRIMIPHWE